MLINNLEKNEFLTESAIHSGRYSMYMGQNTKVAHLGQYYNKYFLLGFNS